MSCTGRPSRPPLALISSAQICLAIRWAFPDDANPPVKCTANPILIGSAACAMPIPAKASANKPPSERRVQRQSLPNIFTTSSQHFDSMSLASTLHTPAPYRSVFDRPEDHALDHEADDDDGEQAGEHRRGLELVAVLEDEPA